MHWLEIFRTFWPVAVVITPLVLGAGILWLQSRFPTKKDLDAHGATLKSDLSAVEAGIKAKIDTHETRLGEGSKKLADLDKRVSLVEEDCRSAPSRQTLQGELSGLSQRMRGVEVQCEGINRALNTQNNYLHTIVETGLRERGPQ